jgi:hypothetical protein
MSIGTEEAAAAAASTAAITQVIKVSGVIVQVGRDAFLTIVARQQAPLVVHATGGLFRTNYQYLTSYKGLAFFTCLSAPLDLPADTEMVLAKWIWVPD